MIKGIFAAGLCLALLLCPGRAEAQEEPPCPETAYQAAASSAVRDGNVAVARQEALAAALRQVVERAALELIGPQGRPEQLHSWLSRPESYVLSYRVVFETEVGAPVGETPEEGAEGRLSPPAEGATGGEAAPPPARVDEETYYCVRVEAVVSLAALKRDLRAEGLLGAEELLPAVAASVEEVAGDVPASRAEEMLLAALRQSGFKVRTSSWWSRRPGPGELAVAASLGVGCGPPGCSAQARLAGREQDTLKAEATGAGEGQTGEEALQAALATAVGSLAKELVALQHQVSVLVRLRGVGSYAELAQIQAALEEMGLAGRERSLRPGEVALEVGTVGGSEPLAKRLAGRKFDGFGLVRAPSAPDTLLLEVTHPGQPPAPAP